MVFNILLLSECLFVHLMMRSCYGESAFHRLPIAVSSGFSPARGNKIWKIDQINNLAGTVNCVQ